MRAGKPCGTACKNGAQKRPQTYLYPEIQTILPLSAALPGQVGAAGHLVDGAVRLLNGRALQLAAQAGFDVGQILLPQRLLLGFFGLGQAGRLALFGQRIDAGDLFFRHGETSCISS